MYTNTRTDVVENMERAKASGAQWRAEAPAQTEVDVDEMLTVDRLVEMATSTTGCAPCAAAALAAETAEADGRGDDNDDGEDDSGDGVATWTGIIGVEGELTGDGRYIQPGALRWENLPMPLRYVDADMGAHQGAQVVGRITTIERDEKTGAIKAKGDFDMDSEQGREAARKVGKRLMNGVSMDLDDVAFEVRVAAEAGVATGDVEPMALEPGEDGRVKVKEVSPDDEVMVTTGARVRAATIVAVPAFSTAMITLTASAPPLLVPPFVREVARAYARQGVDSERALRMAMAKVREMAKGNVADRRMQLQAVVALAQVVAGKGGVEYTVTADESGYTITPTTPPSDAVCAHDGCTKVPDFSVSSETDDVNILYCGEHAAQHEDAPLPEAARKIADGLLARGRTPSEATSLAITTLRRWAEGGTVAASGGALVGPQTMEMARSALLDWESGGFEFNWVQDVGGLPRYIKRIAKHLRAKGRPEGQAIAVAVNVVKRMCATGDTNFPGVQQVNAKSRAEACKAVAEWEAKKARARAQSSADAQALAAVETSEEADADPQTGVARVGGRRFRVENFRDYKPATREKQAKKGIAMPDGSYPIANCGDLKNAIQAIGRAKNRAAVEAHIRTRKRALKCKEVSLPFSLTAAATATGHWDTQMRVPQGNGRRSGRWIDMPGAAMSDLSEFLDTWEDDHVINEDAARELDSAFERVQQMDEVGSVKDKKFRTHVQAISDNLENALVAIGTRSDERARVGNEQGPLIEEVGRAKDKVDDFLSVDLTLFDEDTDLNAGPSPFEGEARDITAPSSDWDKVAAQGTGTDWEPTPTPTPGPNAPSEREAEINEGVTAAQIDLLNALDEVRADDPLVNLDEAQRDLAQSIAMTIEDPEIRDEFLRRENVANLTRTEEPWLEEEWLVPPPPLPPTTDEYPNTSAGARANVRASLDPAVVRAMEDMEVSGAATWVEDPMADGVWRFQRADDGEVLAISYNNENDVEVTPAGEVALTPAPTPTPTPEAPGPEVTVSDFPGAGGEVVIEDEPSDLAPAPAQPGPIARAIEAVKEAALTPPEAAPADFDHVDPVTGRRWDAEGYPPGTRARHTPNGVEVEGAGHVPVYGEVKEANIGRVYELSAKRAANTDGVLVHGTIEAFGKPATDHAWVEYPDQDRVWEPSTGTVYSTADFEALFKPDPKIDYTAAEVAQAMSDSGYFGPWSADAVSDRNLPLLDRVERGPGTPEGSGSPDDPIDVKGDIELAATLLAQGKSVRLNHIDEVGTLLERLNAIANDAKAKGEQAPNYDLCQVSVPGTNLFCVDNLGIPRTQMPQLGGNPVPGTPADALPRVRGGEVDITEQFKAELVNRGIKTEKKKVPASALKATQNQLVGTKVAGIMTAMETAPADSGLFDPIFVTKDHYVIDGHHRWAAEVGLDALDGNLGDVQMNVVEIDMEIGEALDLANAFAKDYGIEQKGTTEGPGWTGQAPTPEPVGAPAFP